MRSILIVIFVFAALMFMGAIFFLQQRRVTDRYERERYFVAIHLLAAQAAGEDGEKPKDLDSLLKLSGGVELELMRPFPDGLVYKADGGSFTLEEPRARSISLFKRDRLMGSDRKWPRWESSGEYARKSPGQQVPVRGYE